MTSSGTLRIRSNKLRDIGASLHHRSRISLGSPHCPQRSPLLSYGAAADLHRQQACTQSTCVASIHLQATVTATRRAQDKQDQHRTHTHPRPKDHPIRVNTQSARRALVSHPRIVMGPTHPRSDFFRSPPGMIDRSPHGGERASPPAPFRTASAASEQVPGSRRPPAEAPSPGPGSNARTAAPAPVGPGASAEPSTAPVSAFNRGCRPDVEGQHEAL